MDTENKEQEVFSEKKNEPKKRTRKKKKVSRGVIIAILSVFALIIGAGVYLIHHYMNMINYIDPATESVLSPSEFAVEDSKYWESVNNPNYSEPDPDASSSETDVTEPTEDPVVRIVREPYQADAYRATLSADDEQVIFDHPVTPTMSQAGPLNDEDLINIMLIGQDTRNTAYRERSDTMILVSINPKTHKVALISFLRDLYVQIGGDYGWNRLNTAFKIGGLQKMYEVYERVFGLHIDGSIYINFGQFMSLVDLLGGVDLTLTETEAKWLRTTLEQSVPDMRYWGQIVEAKMPTIKAGTTVKEAIQMLTDAELSYAYADANGGATPDNIANAAVKALYLDAEGKTKAKAGTYYALQRTIYIEYSETRITFPTIPDEASVESIVKLLTSNGFKVAYANKNGNTAPYDSKSALVSAVYRDSEGKTKFNAGEKYAQDTVAYIAYTENVASIPTIPAGSTVAEAESLLKSAGLAVAWSSQNNSAAPNDKTKATVTGVWLDQGATKALKAGDKLDINATVYLSYDEPVETTEEPTTEEATTEEPTTEGPTEPTECQHLHMVDAYSENSNGSGTHKHTRYCKDCNNYTVLVSDAEACEFILQHTEPATCTVNGYTISKCSKCGAVQNGGGIPALGHEYVWTSNHDGTHTGTCSRCNNVKTENCTIGSDGKCTVCGYKPEEPTTAEPTTAEPTTAEPTTAEPTTAEPTTAEPTTAAEESTDAPAQGNNGANQSNENLTYVSSAEVFNSYVTAVPAANGQQIAASAMSKGLYNPIVRPMSSSSSASSSDPFYLQNIKAGPVHLSGMQTLAYCRMRKLDSDIKRTERQRTVLNILFNKVKKADIATLDNLLTEILRQVTTDLTKTEILQIAAIVLPYFSSINLEMHSIPAQGTYSFAVINKQAVLTMNQAQNIAALSSWLPY